MTVRRCSTTSRAAPGQGAARRLQAIRANEARLFPPTPLSVVASLSLAMLSLDASKLGVTCGSALYWSLTLAAVPVALGVSVWARAWLLRDNRNKARVNYTFARGDVRWTTRTSVLFPSSAPSRARGGHVRGGWRHRQVAAHAGDGASARRGGGHLRNDDPLHVRRVRLVQHRLRSHRLRLRRPPLRAGLRGDVRGTAAPAQRREPPAQERGHHLCRRSVIALSAACIFASMFGADYRKQSLCEE